MAWDKPDITTDISSQVHAKGGPKANEIQATKHEAKNTAKKIDQILNENHKNDLIQKNIALTPAEQQEVNDKSKMSSADEISVNLSAQAEAARRTDSIAFDKPAESVREKNNKLMKEAGGVEPAKQQEEMMKILSGQTPASMGNTLGQAERAMDGAGFSGYSNRRASGLGGYEEAVKTTAKIDQDHPNNPSASKARIEGIEEDRPLETKPGQPESGVGKTIDDMI